MDIDSNIDIAKKYGIMSVPTILVFDKGEVVKKSIGLIDENAVKSLIL